MMKQWFMTLGTGFGALIALGACEQGGETAASQTVATLTEAATDCFAQYEACVADGNDQVVCKERFIACAEAYDEERPPRPDGDAPPPPEEGEPPRPDGDVPPPDGGEDPRRLCEEKVRACFESGQPPEECDRVKQACFGEVPPPPDGGPADPNDPAFACEQDHRACLESGRDPWACDEALRACFGGSTQDPAPCEAEFRACLESGREPWTCEDAFKSCLGVLVPPPPTEVCEDKLRACHDAGEDPARCEEAFRQCVDSQAPPVPGDDHHCPGGVCQAGLDACLGHSRDLREKEACYQGFAACRLSLDESAY